MNPSCLLNCCSGTSNLPSKSTQSLRMTRQSQPKPGYKNNIRKGWVGKRQKLYEKLSQLEGAHMNSQLREQDMALWRGAGVKDASGKHRIKMTGFEVENRNWF